MQKTIASIYDFPTYYDLVFGSDTAAELRFLNKCFERFVDGSVKRVFEPACGTGRLLYRMGQSGFHVGGIDLNAKAVEYCNKRLARLQLRGRAMVGDMADFEVKEPFDAAFNTINSFRHLPTEKSAVAHLDCVSRAVRVGGIYVLGLHLTPTVGDATDEESWSARRGQLSINTHMWPIEKNTRKRLERFGIRFDIYKPTDSMRIEDVLELRSYTLKQFRNLLESVTSWETLEFYDFAYDIRKPAKLGPDTEDVVAILKKR
ncbi:MAG: class I SAM-dependent methyltransferase [Planctomycetales bacterium]|nr:class I SAM-dependent methyltransferase [Planctomycetales bacterium]